MSLRGSGLSDEVLRLACRQVLAGGLPLRDAIVLREARRIAEMRTPRSAAAWSAAAGVLSDWVPESTFRLWIAPIQVVGEDGATLILTAPDNVRAWLKRRYSHLITEALQGTGFERVEFISANTFSTSSATQPERKRHA